MILLYREIKNILKPLLLSAMLLGVLPISVYAIDITRFSGVPIKNDIVLSPAKVEMSLDPGAQSVKYLNILNRTGQDAIFTIEIQDFAPSQDPRTGVVLGKTVDGADSSLRKYISVDTSEFTLVHGEQARIPVTINLPKTMASGGRYAAVLISGTPAKNAPGATKIVTQLGALFSVKVGGVVESSGPPWLWLLPVLVIVLLILFLCTRK